MRLAFTLTLVLAAPLASAQVLLVEPPAKRWVSSAETKAAEKAYQKATAAYAKRRYTQALEHAERCFSLVQSPPTAIALGAVLEELGRTREAFRMFLIALQLQPIKDDLAYLGRHLGTAGKGLYPPMGVVELRRVTTGLKVSVHGVEVPGAFAGVEVGDHELVAEAEGYLTWRKLVTIPAGELVVLDVALERKPEPVPEPPVAHPAPAPVTQEPPPPTVVRIEVQPLPSPAPPPMTVVVKTEATGTGSSGIQVGGWFTLTIGLAAAAGGGLALGLGALDRSEARSAMASGSSELAKVESLEEQAALRETIGYGLLGAGGGVALTGVILLAVGYSQEPEAAPSAAPTAVSVSPLQGGIAWQGTWKF